jgi:ABC-type dipeptide/oligopeptide/nickel transport system permease component
MESKDLLEQLLPQFQSVLVISLLISLACAVLCGFIAARRQARWVYWSVMGFAFGPFALPFVFMAKPKGPENTKS